MRHVWVATWCALLLLTCVDCTDSEPAASDSGARPGPSDAGTDAALHDLDSAVPVTVDASVDLPFLVIAALLEAERSLIARCPCLTANGEYESASECVRAVNLGRNWIDCANSIDLSAEDSPENRESLRCNIAELSLRSECLMGSTCAESAIATCMTQSLGCSMLPYELISKVVSECMVALSR